MATLKDIKKQQYQIVKDILTAFIEKKKQRRTLERYAILQQVYALEKHFTIEEIYILMLNSKCRVSKATLYNTIDLFLECGLVRKHQQIDPTQATYEASFFSRQHDHIICQDTGEVLEFCDPQIQNIKKYMEEIFDIKIHSHMLYFYATKNPKNEDKNEDKK